VRYVLYVLSVSAGIILGMEGGDSCGSQHYFMAGAFNMSSKSGHAIGWKVGKVGFG
jgi:hypothetical protein